MVMLAMSGQALANDTMAELRTGGLVFVESADVSMVEEELYLSMDEVRVDYVFRNTGDDDVTSIVAFPMPDIVTTPDSNVAIPDYQSDNFLGFTVTQDGQPIKPQLQQRISALSVDWTEELRRRNISLLPYSDKAEEDLKSLPKEILKEWSEQGLLFADSFDAGQGMQTIYRPNWTLHSTYFWKTTFPKGKDVHVSHRYKPSIGGTVAISFISEGKPNETYADYKTRYCMDDSFLKTATKLSKAAETGGAIYTEAWLSYILKTGANWGGMISKFKLTVDKGKPENYVSFCGEGVTKTGPTTFVMEKTDFWPQKDLDLLFLVKAE